MKYSFIDLLRTHESEVRDLGIIVSFLILAYIAKKLELPIELNLDGSLQPNNIERCDVIHEIVYSDRDFQTNKMFPHKVAEEAIDLILKGINRNSWDSERIKAANDICEIANSNKLNEDICCKALEALGELKDSADWSSTKRTIMGLIKKLVTS